MTSLKKTDSVIDEIWEEEVIIILALAHHRRRPFYWIDRVKNL